MKTGRNDPCPCGSGKKYKHCCMQSADASVESAEDVLRRRVRRAIEDLPEQMLRFMQSQLGAELIAEAWADFAGEDIALDIESPQMAVFLPWFLHQWSPNSDTTRFPKLAARDATVTSEYLERNAKRLDPLVVRYLEACAASAFSFHEVIEVDPGRGFVLRDLILDREASVLEHSASKTAQRGDIIFAQVVTLGTLAMLEACAPMIIQPRDKPAIIALRKALRGRGVALDNGLLKEACFDLIDQYQEIAERTLSGRMPQLQNTDGDPLSFHRLVFDIKDADAAAGALDSARVAARETIGQDSEVKRDANGRIVQGQWTWSRAGNAMHKSWDNTTLGHIDLNRRKLHVEVNSARRAARARTMVEKLLGSNATYRATQITSAEKMVAEARNRPTPRGSEESERLMQLPEVREQVAAMLMKHYRDWLDMKVPALGELTPRQAVRQADGREAVAALITQIERDAARMSPPLDPAIPAMLRRELGLE